MMRAVIVCQRRIKEIGAVMGEDRKRNLEMFMQVVGSGVSVRDMAIQYELSVGRIRKIVKREAARCGLLTKDEDMGMAELREKWRQRERDEHTERTERNAEIFHAMVVYGFTLKEVAERHGLSLERVGQIVLLEAKRMGIVDEEETSRSIKMIRRAYFRHIGNGLMVML